MWCKEKAPQAEDGMLESSNTYSDLFHPDLDVLKAWEYAVEGYSDLLFKNPKQDRPVALDGVASEFRNILTRKAEGSE